MQAIEQIRVQVSKATTASKKSQLGQFFTPATTAKFMASLFPNTTGKCRLLDAGAGIGSLSDAFLARWRSGGFGFHQVELDAFEIDQSLHAHLQKTLGKYCTASADFSLTVHRDDYIFSATQALAGYLFSGKPLKYSHVILNPPYKKINSQSSYRLALRGVGIETVNLYSAFVALAVAQVAHGGQVVAIIPRSFCNGPYYRPFRDFILERAAIRHIHLFNSRDKAFKDDDVLQENIILHLEVGGRSDLVTVSTSTDDSFSDLKSHKYPFERIVFPEDRERFIHIPTTPAKNAIEFLSAVRYSLSEIGLQVSTGPVVDFRLKEHLRDMPELSTVPLLYPAHFSLTGPVWPIPGLKKPNAIIRNEATEKWLYPLGFYCVVRRFSSKEERRRVVASLLNPAGFMDYKMLGLENHLNVFHQNKQGLPEALARGLMIFLNSTAVDEQFRCFNGHTQINATDLKRIKYPSRETLIRLGEWAFVQGALTQDQIDARVATLT